MQEEEDILARLPGPRLFDRPQHAESAFGDK
jgi:hypothetical protein